MKIAIIGAGSIGGTRHQVMPRRGRYGLRSG
jgi:malate/lactate dehydrogenase